MARAIITPAIMVAVGLLMDPNNPGVAVVNSFLELWALPTLFFLITSPIVLLGMYRFVRGVADALSGNTRPEVV